VSNGSTLKKLNDSVPLLSVDDAALYLNIPKSTIYMLCKRRIIPCVKIGKHWRCSKDTLDKWIAEQSQKPCTD